MYSQVESTICSHHPATPRSRPSRPLVKGNDGKFYPKKPITNYINRFANGFSDCLGCGSETHLFRGCPEKHTSEIKKNYFLDLNAHVPSTRNEEVVPTSQSNNVSLYTNSSHYNPSAHQNNLSVYTNLSNSNPPANQSSIKKARFCAIFARVTHVSPSSQKPMLIPINNSLPSVCIHPGSVEDEENKIRMLLDTSTVMNLGSLTYHLWVMW